MWAFFSLLFVWAISRPAQIEAEFYPRILTFGLEKSVLFAELSLMWRSSHTFKMWCKFAFLKERKKIGKIYANCQF